MEDRSRDQPPDTRRPECATYDVHDDERLGTAVVKAIAGVAGIETREMNRKLYDAADPDALETLFDDRYDGGERAGGRIEFALLDYAITVTSDGRILVERPQQQGMEFAAAGDVTDDSTPASSDRAEK